MNQTFTIKEKTKQIFVLLIPILITQLGMFSMVVFNTIMSGRYSSSDLAGVAIGSSIWGPVFNGISGIFLAVSPIAAQRFGQKKPDEVAAVVRHGMYLSVMIAIIIFILGFFLLNPILDMMNLSTEVKDIAFGYLVGLSIGMLPLFIFNVLRSFIYALGKTRIIMVIMLLSLPINLVLNYVLIFGKLGFPELGGVGAGYATAITDWVFLGMTIFIITKQEPFSSFRVFSNLREFSWEHCKEILKIGVPMGLSVFFETTVFAIVTILLSKFNVTTIAAYQSALNVVSFIYMIPISISTALTVLVGFEVGARRYKDAKQYSWLGVGIALLIAIGTGLIVVAFRYPVAGLYSNETAVIYMTANFLIFALFFQISDAIQATAQAALRGYKDVNIAFVMTLVAYWFICLPAGYLLANYTGLGAKGYWIGLTIGLLAAGICLSLRLIHIQKKKFNAAVSQ
ncbi:MATE family efflux transporter [Bacillus sp. USDA818B3_A]|uniref:MATE family efflux transporter n=1 Tax=Bacillus sp. USDA818B3_A TaxID=2698834 RepID=UPI00136F20A0|nr:MATE family efflux transporter [Bacillus sp. USDA818B3_A]